jgi:GTP-binding nuclear protein Ran
MPSQPKTYKIIFAGDSNTGKSTYLERYRSGDFLVRYDRTYGAITSVIPFHTSSGKFVFNVWDISSGLRDGYYCNADAAVIFFDKTNKRSFENVPNWIREITAVSPDVKIVIVGTKCDLPDSKVTYREIEDLIGNSNMEYYDISAKSNYNFEKPFLSLMRKFSNDPELTINQVY